jgi:DNA-binding transcriptional regulator GbsR (MarR family)
MAKKYVRRKNDNGWRAKLRTWGVGGLFLAFIFSAGGAATVIADNKENIKTLSQMQQEQVKAAAVLSEKATNTEKTITAVQKKIDKIYDILVQRSR